MRSKFFLILAIWWNPCHTWNTAQSKNVNKQEVVNVVDKINVNKIKLKNELILAVWNTNNSLRASVSALLIVQTYYRTSTWSPLWNCYFNCDVDLAAYVNFNHLALQEW